MSSAISMTVGNTQKCKQQTQHNLHSKI
jgi:hypothetical protein